MAIGANDTRFRELVARNLLENVQNTRVEQKASSSASLLNLFSLYSMGSPIIDSVTSVIPRFDASLNLLLHVSFGTELGYSVELTSTHNSLCGPAALWEKKEVRDTLALPAKFSFEEGAITL